MKLLFEGSFARAILLAFLIISIVPLLLISPLFINQSTAALTEQMEKNLQILVEAKAEEINIKLTEVLGTTEIAAHQAAYALEQDLDEAEIAERMARYAPDQRNILGLDVYYIGAGGEETLGTGLSNVYWNNDVEADGVVARQIVTTEALDATFAGIKAVSPETQWIYMTTPQGMMRLYPWAGNDHYPDKWDPREIIFYTVAEPDINPDMETRWTPPYVDFAGAGWMVTVSTPIITQDGDFFGIMSHDITIQSLKDIALNINVLDGAGFGFLIDNDGTVIAHPDFQDADASKGDQESANLLTTGPAEFRTVVSNMVDGQTGLGSYVDEDREEQIVVYAPIPSIGWSLGIIVPHSEVVAPATTMRSRALLVTLLLIVASSMTAFLLARRIHRPIGKLLQGAKQLSDDRRPDEIMVNSFSELRELSGAFNEMVAKVWARETNLKKTVADLRIQIDRRRSEKQIEALGETEYFQYLEQNAERIRQTVRNSAPTSSESDVIP